MGLYARLYNRLYNLNIITNIYQPNSIDVIIIILYILDK